jgi:protein-S-isoprenylcysteine O-methyltransferase Ste14
MADPSSDTPGVIAPPPLITFAALGIGFALEAVWPLATLPAPEVRHVLGIALALGAFAVPLDSFRRFRRAGTSVETRHATTALVTNGLYRFSRNPIYVSMGTGVAAVGIAAGSLWVTVMVVPLMVMLHYGVVRREERYLERKFGDDYRRYCARVRRWL